VQTLRFVQGLLEIATQVLWTLACQFDLSLLFCSRHPQVHFSSPGVPYTLMDYSQFAHLLEPSTSMIWVFFDAERELRDSTEPFIPFDHEKNLRRM
jgi:hypothetical protein